MQVKMASEEWIEKIWKATSGALKPQKGRSKKKSKAILITHQAQPGLERFSINSSC
jgi:hypothetical protein